MKKSAELNKKCGIRLQEMRKGKGLTQRELAERIPCAMQYISSLENGKRPICEQMARELSSLLDVRPEYLLCIDDYKKESERYRSLSGKDSLMRCLATFIDHTGYVINELENENQIQSDDLILNTPPVKKWIIKDMEGNYTTCSRENIYDLLEDIQGYIEFRLERFSSKCQEATPEEISKYKSQYENTKIEIFHSIKPIAKQAPAIKTDTKE